MPVKNQRFWLTTDSQDIVIDAPADAIYGMVSDLTRMGEWSTECERVEWEGGATGPAVDAKFVGHNRGGPFNLMRWSRRGRVLTADPAREFAFATEEGGSEGTVWRYRFEAMDDGRTRVTESYEVGKIPVWARILDVPTNRHRELLEGMRHTLALLKTAAETATSRLPE